MYSLQNLTRILFIIILLCNAGAIISQTAFPLNSTHGTTKAPLQIHVKNELNEKSFLSSHMPKGKIYLVSIWATWCAPCLRELRTLQKVHCDWSEQYNFEFLAISIDAPKVRPKIFEMVNNTDWNFKVLHDEYGYLVKELDISNIPRMFLVDQKGNIVYKPTGFHPSELARIKDKIAAL